MENKLFLLSGSLLLAASLLFSSCERIAEPVHSDFKIERLSQTLYGNAIHIRFNSNKTSEATSLARRMSDKCEKDMMRWADYSSFDTTP